MKDKVKRLGVFCIYDKTGTIDDYILFLLKDIKKELSKLVVVCNGHIDNDGRLKLEQYADEIVVRENKGFDAWAWRCCLIDCKYIEKLIDYDELVLFNDTFFGPFYSFADIFSNMDKSSADFWGITVHGSIPNPWPEVLPVTNLPEHIQSYFMVIRKNMMVSKSFKEYWNNLKEIHNFEEAICFNEALFTKHFSDLGFSYDVYCDTRSLEKENDVKINHYLFSQQVLLEKYKCPFIKRKALNFPIDIFLQYNYGEEIVNSLAYIKKNTSYDINLIYNYLLRTENMADIVEHLKLEYILPIKSRTTKNDEIHNVAVVAHLFYPELMSYSLKYLRNIPKDIDIFITTNTDEKKSTIEKNIKGILYNNVEIRVVNGRGRDLAALLVGCKDVFKKYEYLAFVHDKKSARSGQAISVGSAFSDLLWENALKSKSYILNVLDVLKNNPKMGFLVPPAPYHGPYFAVSNDYWAGSVEAVRDLSRKLGVEQFISFNKRPLALGTVFWCKTKALESLLSEDWQYEDFHEEPLPIDGTVSHALERIFPYVAQKEGFFTGEIMNAEWAATEIVNFRFLFNRERNKKASNEKSGRSIRKLLKKILKGE